MDAAPGALVSYRARCIGWLGTKVLCQLGDGHHQLAIRSSAKIKNVPLCKSERKPTPETSPSRDAWKPAASSNAGAPAAEPPR
eukprot:9164099-Pyramimonas_sp.AAC.1